MKIISLSRLVIQTLFLGVQWLEKLGTVSTNWKTQTLKLLLGGKSITLKGDPSLGRSMISLKSMLRTIRKGGEGYTIECNHLAPQHIGEKIVDTAELVPTFLQQVLKKHDKVFHFPKGLPPSRGQEHTIRLREGTDHVSVRPYRYPQSQKDEIEALIRDMLHVGIIRESTSPFSSPVLLVKKKKRRLMEILRGL